MTSECVRVDIESRESKTLSEFAAKASLSKGREVEEPQDSVRTIFQRDRDRILHSKAFRRLKHKTQVFIAPEGDHYRTRLTHTLEVAQISKTIGRALSLNEDLIEAIALGHDVGHPPFGHAGEAALDEAVRAHFEKTGYGPDRFRHFEQSLRLLQGLEKLNLSFEVTQGIGGHSKGEGDFTDADGSPVSTLEASVVRVSDRIAYLNHDLDDAIRSGIIKDFPKSFEGLGTTTGKRIGTMVELIIQASLGQPRVNIPPALMAQLNEIKDWLFENVYFRYPERFPDIKKSQALVKDLFWHYVEPGNLPEGFEGVWGALDYVSGMTDRFAIKDFVRLRVPSGYPI